jgi:hypothetical protein
MSVTDLELLFFPPKPLFAKKPVLLSKQGPVSYTVPKFQFQN